MRTAEACGISLRFQRVLETAGSALYYKKKDDKNGGCRKLNVKSKNVKSESVKSKSVKSESVKKHKK